MNRRLLALIATILLLAVGSLGACGDDPPASNILEQRVSELERRQRVQDLCRERQKLIYSSFKLEAICR